MYTVTLSAIQNPDFPRRYDLPRKRIIKVETLRDAAVACRDYLEKYDLGGGNWSGGYVHDAAGVCVAYVSFNGRIWTPERDYRNRREIGDADMAVRQ